jgi:hypothetical protein
MRERKRKVRKEKNRQSGREKDKGRCSGVESTENGRVERRWKRRERECGVKEKGRKRERKRRERKRKGSKKKKQVKGQRKREG